MPNDKLRKLLIKVEAVNPSLDEGDTLVSLNSELAMKLKATYGSGNGSCTNNTGCDNNGECCNNECCYGNGTCSGNKNAGCSPVMESWQI